MFSARANAVRTSPVEREWSSALLRPSRLCFPTGAVERDGGADERLERVRVDLLALADVDRAPRVPLEARVEELRRILQRRAFGESQLHRRLVGFAGADDPIVRPDGVHPFPLLDHLRVCFLYEGAHPSQRLAAPVIQLANP